MHTHTHMHLCWRSSWMLPSNVLHWYAHSILRNDWYANSIQRQLRSNKCWAGLPLNSPYSRDWSCKGNSSVTDPFSRNLVNKPLKRGGRPGSQPHNQRHFIIDGNLFLFFPPNNFLISKLSTFFLHPLQTGPKSIDLILGLVLSSGLVFEVLVTEIRNLFYLLFLK